MLGDRVALRGARPTTRSHGADALVIVTEWHEYRNPDFERMKQALRRPLIVDGRNLYDPARACAALGFTYDSHRPAPLA